MKRAPHAARAPGFTLLPVVLAMSLIAAIAFLLNRDNGMNAAMIARQSDLERARYAAEAGLQAVNYQVQQQGCAGSFPTSAAPVTNANFGGGAYSAYADKASGTPLLLSATGSYNGASVTLSRANVPVFQSAMQTVTLQPAPAQGQDAYIDTSHPTFNYGVDTTLQLRTGPSEILLRFDLSSLAAGSRVIPYADAGGALQPGAVLSLYQSANSSSTGQISVHLITQSWVEGTGIGGATANGATWNTYDGVNNWPAPGSGYDARALSTTNYVAANGWYTWDITDAALAWTGSVYPNYGVRMRTSSGTISNAQYVSSDEPTNITLRPKVTLNYLVPCGTTTTVTLPAIQDTWIDQTGSGTANYGGDSTFTVTNANKKGRGLLLFNLSSVPAGTTLKSATLQLWAKSFTSPANSNLTANKVFNPWTENGANWVTRDGVTSWSGGAGGYYGFDGGLPISTQPITSAFVSGWVQWDVKPLAQGWLSGTYPNYGVGVMIDTSSVVTFASREESVNVDHRPQLVITY